MVGALVVLLVAMVVADTWLYLAQNRRRVPLDKLADPAFNPRLDGLVIEPPHWKRNDA
ncbi:hypothetical protein GCM10010466_39620 [Planomonospora alba]|uniref:Uncharacterized protein n=1 Tax=Planomonospora alba TaxID=161354 RepID=A0ABP6NIA4_9ACTN